MNPTDRPHAQSASSQPSGRFSPLGEVLGPVGELFTRSGMLGVVLIDAAPLAAVEHDYGDEACTRCMAALGELVREVVRDQLGGEELVAFGETGRHEILVLLLREPRQGAFYRTELPRFRRELQRALERHGQRAVYPYLRKRPIFGSGYAAAMRNPHLGAATQIQNILRDAREDARLVARVAATQRRKEFVGLVLAGEVTSVYEPIVEVTSKTVFGYEALARGPAGTDFHSPAVLFETATRENLVFELDCLCRQSGLAGAEDLPGGTKLFLNVRPTTMHDPSFRPEALIRTLERSGLQPGDLVFEISEQESIRSFDLFREVRDEYGKLGFQFALDDTGAGYASLQAVMELAPEFIKVDRALVRDIDRDPARRTLLAALHTVAGRIGSRIIAEGLDRLEELETLGELQIPFGQGWLFGKPTPLAAPER